MATLPNIYDFRGGAPQPSAGVASFQPRESQAGDVLSSAGRTLQDAAATLAATNERQDTMVAQSAANALALQRIGLQTDPKTGFSSVKGESAVGQQFVDTYTERYEGVRTSIRARLESPLQQKVFDQHAQADELHFKAALLQHQSQQTDAFNDKTENDTIDLARMQVFANPGNPSATSAALAQMDAMINAKAARLGWSNETLSLTKQKYLESVFNDSVDQRVESNPLGTLPLLDKRLGVGGEPALTGDAAIDGLDPKHLVEFHHRAEAYRMSLQNKQDAELKAALKEAQKVTEEAQKFVMAGGMVSPEYAARLKAATSGLPYEPMIDGLVKMSYAGAGFGTRPLGEQEQLLRAFDAQAAQGSSPEQQEIIKLARNAHDAQGAAYKDNPWAAAARFGRQPDTPEVQIKTPDQIPQIIQQRAKAQGVIEQYANGAVSGLQPDEATAAAKLIRTLPPEQAGAVLGQMGVAADTPERVQALAKQLGKNDEVIELQMLAAGDKTTYGRYLSELIGRGARALSDKTIKVDKSDVTGWESTIAGLVNDTLGDPQEEAKVKKAAFYVRAAMEDKGSLAPGFTSISNSDEESAVAMVVGRPLTRGGVKTLMPRGMTEFDFNAALKKFTPEVLASMSIAAEPHYDATTQAAVLGAITSGKSGVGIVPGMVQPGSIDLRNRPQVMNADGSVSTVLSFSVGIDGKEVLLPRIMNGKLVTETEAIAAYKKTGQSLGVFDSVQTADAYAKTLHEQQQGFADPKGKLYFNGRPVEPSFVWNRIDSLPIQKFGSGYVPMQNNRPFTLDEAGTIPLVLKVTP